MDPTEDEGDVIEGPDVPMPDVRVDPETGEPPDGWEFADE